MDRLLGWIQGGVSYSMLMPPTLFIALALVGVVAAWRWRRVGPSLATASVVCLYAAAMPAVAAQLILWNEALGARMAAASPAMPPPEAIVVLSADIEVSDSPDKPDRPGLMTLERLEAAARDARRLKLPLLVSGGLLGDAHQSLAAVMADSLQQDFGISVKWQEDRSVNTFQNALYSAAILRRAGIRSAYVVSHPWDIARALWSFRRVGYPVVPLPVPRGHRFALDATDFLPSAPALADTYYALHELIGLVWYPLRYGTEASG